MKLALVLLMSAVGFGQAKPQDQPGYIVAGIRHYKADSDVMEYIVRGNDTPAMKACRGKGWPNTEECRGVAISMVKTMQLYLDNKLPGFERPQFDKGGK